MTDPVAFLAARLDEDEAAARAVKPLGYVSDMGGRRLDEKFSHGRLRFASEDGRSRIEGDSAAASHFARHDPARVLREVAAGRMLLREHDRLLRLRERWETNGRALLHFTPFTAPGYPTAVSQQREADFLDGAEPILLRLVLAKASVYSDHPDYDQEWKLS